LVLVSSRPPDDEAVTALLLISTLDVTPVTFVVESR